MLQEFKDFINKGNVLMVAVGLVMALYFQEIINAVLDGMLNPIIGVIFGESDYRNIGVDLGNDGARLRFGLVLDAAIKFVLVAFLLFLVVKAYNKYVKKDADEAAGPSETELLTEIRDLLRNR